MKVLKGLHRKFLKTDLVNEEFHCFCRSEKPRFNIPRLFFPPFLLFSLLPLSSPRLLPSCFYFFHSEVCKISRGVQHRRHETHLQEGVHHPSAQETSYPPAVGGFWGAAGWVWTADTMKLSFFFLGVRLYWQFAFMLKQVTPRKPVESWSPWRPRFQVWQWCVSGGLALNVGTATWLKLRPCWASPWRLRAPSQRGRSTLSSWPGSTWRCRETWAKPRRCCLMLSRVTR